MRNPYQVLAGTAKGKTTRETLDADGRITVKWTSKK
jgi:hypothetical protein